MRIGLQLGNFTWGEGTDRIGPRLADIVRTAESAGFASVSVMDHLFQIPVIGPSDHEMLEAYTALGFIAAHTSRILSLVTIDPSQDTHLEKTMSASPLVLQVKILSMYQCLPFMQALLGASHACLHKPSPAPMQTSGSKLIRLS